MRFQELQNSEHKSGFAVRPPEMYSNVHGQVTSDVDYIFSPQPPTPLDRRPFPFLIRTSEGFTVTLQPHYVSSYTA